MPPDAPAPTEFKEQSLLYQLRAFGKLWPYLWSSPSNKARVVIAVLFTIAGQFVLVAAPFFLGRMTDALDQGQDAGVVGTLSTLILMLIAGYAGLRVLSILLSEGREYLFAPVAQYAQRQTATSTFAHLHKLSLRYHLEKRTGGLSRIIERGVRAIEFLFRFLLFNIGPTLILLVVAAGAFWRAYDIWFAVIAVATVAIYMVWTITTTEWRLKFRRRMNKLDTEAAARAVDSLLNYETVKYFNAEGAETARYDQAMHGYQRAAIASRTSLATVNVGQNVIMNAGLFALMWLTATRISAGEMTVGAIVTITLVMGQLYRPLNILGWAYREIKQGLADMEKMFSLLDVTPEVSDRDGATALADVVGDIVFSDVDFRYDPDRPILKGVSFHARPGERIAVVGPTGAGKSTLSRILYRFYDIEGGSVRIDGHDIRDLTQDSLRAAIGIVPQDTVLFNDTIGYNIAYARPDATQDEIESAARAARIHDFIVGLPEGYNTVVGERGLKLSGGEKQRVAIARTLLKDPAILILDEATSALDNTTEAEIQSALETAGQGRTTLVVAHRLSTIQTADRILVMRDGEIVERGTHAELLARSGLYAELWAAQEGNVMAAAE